MHFDEPEGSPARQLQLSKQFAVGSISGPEFETAFLQARGLNAGLADVLADVLVQIFYGVDDYVADDELRPKIRGGIDEEQLREIVRTQLRRLDEA